MKNQWIEEKCTTEPLEVKSPQPIEPSQDSSDSTELLDVPWARTWKGQKKTQKTHETLTWNHPLHHNRIPDHENRTTANET